MAIIGSSRGLIPFNEIPIRPKLRTVTGFLGGKRRPDDEEMALESGNRQRKQQKEDKQPQQVERQQPLITTSQQPRLGTIAPDNAAYLIPGLGTVTSESYRSIPPEQRTHLLPGMAKSVDVISGKSTFLFPDEAEGKIEISSRVPSEQEQLQMQQQAKGLKDEFDRHFQEKQRRFGEEFNEFTPGGRLDLQRDLHLQQMQQQQERELQRQQDAQETQEALRRQEDERNQRDLRRGLLGR